MKRRLAEVRCWSLSGLRSCRWEIRTPSGRWGRGDWAFLTVTLLGFGFWFCFFAFCVIFTPIFFCPFKFSVWSNYCFVHSPFVEAQEISSPLRGGAVPSHRTCILVTGLLRKPRCAVLAGSPLVRPVLVTPGCDTPLRAMHWALFFSVFGRGKTTLIRCCTNSTHIFQLSFLKLLFMAVKGR